MKLELKQNERIVIFPLLVLVFTVWFNFIPFVDYYDMAITSCDDIENGVSCNLENNNLHYESSIDYWYGEINHHSRMSDSENYDFVSWTVNSVKNWISINLEGSQTFSSVMESKN